MFGPICVEQRIRDPLIQGNWETNEVYSGFVQSFAQAVGQFDCV